MAETPDDLLSEDGVMASGSEVPAVETGVEPTPVSSKKPWGAIAGAGVVTAAVVVGALVVSGGGSEIDTTETTTAVEESEQPSNEDTSATNETADADGAGDAVEGEADTPDDTGEVSEEADAAELVVVEDDEFAEDFAMEAMDSAVSFGGSSGAVFDGERFISLSMNEAGWAVRTSADGVDWSESPATGLPAEGYITWLDVQDGTLVAAIDSYSEADGQTVSIATSQDGTSWSVTALPSAGDNAGFSGAALTNDGVMVLLTRFEEGFGDEIELLLSLGLIEEGAEESYCGFDQLEPGGDIMVYICNFEDYDEFDEVDFQEPSEEELQALADAFDAATTDEERAAIEAQLEELWGAPYVGDDETITIAPGDPGFDELSEIRAAQSNPSMPLITLTGPFEGPFSVVNEFDAGGYANGLAATNTGLFIGIDTYQETSGSVTTLMSWNGTAWAEIGTPLQGVSGQLHSLGDALLFTGYDNSGGESTLVSTDGSSWDEVDFGTAGRGGYTQIVSGEAGAVAVTMVYDGPGFLGPDEEIITIEKDGFVLELETFTGDATLSTADGVLVHDLDPAWEPGPDSDIARLNPISGDITFLDPETGEDLVVITNDDFDAAFGYEDFDEDYVEPEQVIEVRTTTDGATWTLVDIAELQTVSFNTGVYPLAVGDDEAVLALETYQEPPAELFAFEEEGREPTSAEIEALELYDGSAFESTYIRIPLG